MASITIKDVARLSGYSISTVSRALNDHRDISPETKEKIQKVIKEYGYIPNNSARNLKKKDSNTISIIVKGISNPFFQDMYTMFEHSQQMRNYTLSLTQVAEDESEIFAAIEAEKEKKLCGVIFFGGYFDEKARDYLKRINVPYVLCTAKMDGDADPATYTEVGIDDELESYKVVKYLTELGHKRIAIIGGKKTDRNIGRYRLQGYYKALKDAGITPDESLVFYMDDNYPEHTPENGYAVMNSMLDSGVDFSAVYVISDNTAYGACKAMLDRGLKIPEDYSLASFDGLEMSRYYHPSLTTMKQPCQRMVDEVVKQLLMLMNAEDGEEVQHVHKIFPAKLIIGQSTAPYKPKKKK